MGSKNNRREVVEFFKKEANKRYEKNRKYAFRPSELKKGLDMSENIHRYLNELKGKKILERYNPENKEEVYYYLKNNKKEAINQIREEGAIGKEEKEELLEDVTDDNQKTIEKTQNGEDAAITNYSDDLLELLRKPSEEVDNEYKNSKRKTLFNLIKTQDIYDVAYKNETFILYLKEYYSYILESWDINGFNFTRPEFKMYLNLFKKAISEDDKEWIEKNIKFLTELTENLNKPIIDPHRTNKEKAKEYRDLLQNIYSNLFEDYYNERKIPEEFLDGIIDLYIEELKYAKEKKVNLWGQVITNDIKGNENRKKIRLLIEKKINKTENEKVIKELQNLKKDYFQI